MAHCTGSHLEPKVWDTIGKSNHWLTILNSTYAYLCNISHNHGIIVLAKSSESGMQNGIGMVASGINGGVMVGG
mgnify:CR=1 FL=1